MEGWTPGSGPAPYNVRPQGDQTMHSNSTTCRLIANDHKVNLRAAATVIEKTYPITAAELRAAATWIEAVADQYASRRLHYIEQHAPTIYAGYIAAGATGDVTATAIRDTGEIFDAAQEAGKATDEDDDPVAVARDLCPAGDPIESMTYAEALKEAQRMLRELPDGHGRQALAGAFHRSGIATQGVDP